MTNYEYYKEQIERIARLGRRVAMDATTGEIVCCVDIDCNECLFQGSEDEKCSQKAFKWADEEYKEPEIDWSKVPIDTPILVSNNKKSWYNRYFAGIDDADRLLIFPDGRTSWSNKGRGCMILPYKYIKLAEIK